MLKLNFHQVGGALLCSTAAWRPDLLKSMLLLRDSRLKAAGLKLDQEQPPETRARATGDVWIPWFTPLSASPIPCVLRTRFLAPTDLSFLFFFIFFFTSSTYTAITTKTYQLSLVRKLLALRLLRARQLVQYTGITYIDRIMYYSKKRHEFRTTKHSASVRGASTLLTERRKNREREAETLRPREKKKSWFSFPNRRWCKKGSLCFPVCSQGVQCIHYLR